MYNKALHFHFIGIGGSGMSGLAEILLTLGYAVSGSDLASNAITARLQSLGATIFQGHAAANVPDNTSSIVYSSAVDGTNPEIMVGKERGIPLVRRAEVLAELMRLKYGVAVAGSHGKTTTTSMVAAILELGGLDPTVVIGGRVKSSGTGGRLGRGEFLVAESDESDRSFLLLKPTVAVVTNIDAEHMSAYRSLEDLEGAFADFVRAVPFYGLAVLCIDDAKVRSLAQQYNGRKVNYGFSSDADLSARDLKHHRQSSQFSLFQRGQRLGEVTLSMPGRHMVLNSLAAIGVALEFGITLPVIQQALSAFQGVDRRLEVIGEAAGVRVMNDYGHHPAEIRATLRAVRDGWGAETKRVIGVFQPHRYTRTRDCFAEFTQAFDDVDVLHVMDIYSAGEPPIDGISGENLCEAIVHQNKRFAGSSGDLLELCLSEVREGDMVVFLGAGSVGALSHQYLATLRELERASVGSDGANRSGSAQS